MRNAGNRVPRSWRTCDGASSLRRWPHCLKQWHTEEGRDRQRDVQWPDAHPTAHVARRSDGPKESEVRRLVGSRLASPLGMWSLKTA